VNYDDSLVVTITVTCYLWAPFAGGHLFTCVHVVFGSQLRPCKSHALDLTIANAWVRFSSQVRGDPHNSQIT